MVVDERVSALRAKYMRIYLDSKDIIDMLERSEPCSIEQFGNVLRVGSHELVLSLTTVIEISKPLLYKKATTNVMRLLYQIDESPHTFIHSSRIVPLELEEAVLAFGNDREYRSILPSFVNRFDIIVDLEANPSTKLYIKYSLAETVWDLYTHGALDGFDQYADKLRETFLADRMLNPRPSLKGNFVLAIKRASQAYGLKIPSDEIESFANWIYSDPSRCPSQRLGYELWHKMVCNIADIPEGSDLEDFLNIGCLPYVDVMTVDRRMYGYICQVAASTGITYDRKIFKNTQKILDIINAIL